MDKPCRTIDLLLFDDVNLLEVAGPVQVFTKANELASERYHLRFMSPDGMDVQTSSGLPLKVTAAAGIRPDAQDLLVPGGAGVDAAMTSDCIRGVISHWPLGGTGNRMIAVCSGALLVARCGLLDGRAATTHWNRQLQAQREFPRVKWATDRIFWQDGPYFSSAGVSAGIDLALDIVRQDCGSSAALAVARHMVMQLKRDGGQSQFSDLLTAQFSDQTQVSALVTAILDNPRKAWTTESMAEAVGLTPRTLTRRFQKAFSTTPHKYLERVRVKLASDVLSSSGAMGKAIEVSGFTDFQQMQRAFKRHLGTTVGAFRGRFDAR